MSVYSADIETSTQRPEYLEGFTDFAEFLGSSRDLALYRRFDVLAARNLLYVQGELLAIEASLREYDERDKKIVFKGNGISPEAMNVLEAAKDWQSFSRHSQTDPAQEQKMKKVLELRQVLKEYQEALVLHSTVLQLPSPENHTLEVVKKWFERKTPFISHGRSLFDNTYDIASLRPPEDCDRLSRSIQSMFGYFFREPRPVPRSWGDNYYYPEQGVAKLVSIITVLIATMLLFGAIAALNFASPRNHGLRLGIIGGFTFVFAITVGILTTAKRSELFTAVAGYSAVLVVFATVNVES
ncbi:uncharacterized protein K452DRAFT_315943 [Aplosporella prunicola CBS 121167]|uniref:DUF6594 domain-containing protein n=1 Tax=Aplosporella prunicola CBS 121167 TaxID=1176127 RepID=A0A6A6BNY2_9PEZI|nr:uncharacterized protein K452DRAFT_315943 [Aplosporella prunicola CBS 121167]KAF2145776.1 hypothetical protein K452DRAFT_315943 [Aplosporella prunicola CBS 121167]